MHAPTIKAATEVTAQFYHLDPMNVVWHGNYVRFFEQARCALLDKIGFNYDVMRTSGYLWPVVDMRVKYVKPVTFRDTIRIEAELKEYENRLKINYLATELASGAKVTSGFTIQVAVDEKTGEMCFRSPDALILAVEQYS